MQKDHGTGDINECDRTGFFGLNAAGRHLSRSSICSQNFRLSGIFIMSKIDECVARAREFERMAGREENLKIKAVFEKQAAASRKAASDHAKLLGLPVPEFLS